MRQHYKTQCIAEDDILMILSQCFRAASKPSLKRRRNSRKGAPSTPPRTSIYSGGSLNGAASNPMFPGVLLRMKPKSMWIKCPSRSNKMFPLWRSLICRRYVTTEYPAGRRLSNPKECCFNNQDLPANDLAKFRCARANLAEDGSP